MYLFCPPEKASAAHSRSFTAALGFLAIIMLRPGLVLGQEVQVHATVNSTTVGLEETVTYSVEIEAGNLSDVSVPSAPEADNLRLVQSNPTVSRNVSIVNGAMSQSVTYRWAYMPIAEGNATIASTTIDIGGSRHHTDPIRLTVVQQSQRPARPSQQPDRWPFSPWPRRQNDPPPTLSSDDLFIRAIPSKRSAYPNEQIVIEYHLFFREHVQVRQSRLANSWDAKGFWREELDVDSRPVARSVVENGLRYRAILLKRVAVFPTRVGTLTVEPLRIETEIYSAGRSTDPFSSFFPSTSLQSAEVSSPVVTIEVQPLPDGAPRNFAGAVGTFQVNASLDSGSVDVGESVQIRVEISGTGNLAMLAPPELDTPGIFERYDPNIETQINRSGRRVSGRKTIHYVMVPRSNGVFDMADVEFAYFDSDRREYVQLRAPLGTLEITGSAGSLAAQATRAGLPVDDIAGLIRDEGAWSRLDRTPLHASPLPYLVLGLPLLLFTGALVYRRRTDRLATDVQYARGRRAHPLARRHLRVAHSLLRANRPRAFYAEVERALLGFIGNRLNLPETGLTRQQLDAHLAALGITDATRAGLHDLLEECDRAQFAPIAPEQAVMETAVDRAGSLIVRLNGEAEAAVSATS